MFIVTRRRSSERDQCTKPSNPVVPPLGVAAQSQVDQGGETQITHNEITKRSVVQQLNVQRL